ncbi:MAG TPA: WecB/TagA/CpsF family glycosyltransferase [Terriglobales bacterium]|nr:WecB/TagA/CpsF family glycosyltransferase [Terriglobales bacterium]
MAQCVPDRVVILGTRVGVFNSYDDAVQLIRQRILSRRQTFCVAINPEKVYRARQDARLARILESAHIPICDGIGISLASMALYRRRLPRCTGVDLFLRLAQLSAEEGWKVFVLGATPRSNEAACRELEDKFPGLRITGRQHGYFENSAAVVDSINRSEAELLFVAMGSPRQEFWLSEHMPRLNTTFCMGVGGSLDVISGTAKRAPALFQKTGTEWLFRLLLQPGRIRRHMALPAFALGVLRSAMGYR